MFLKSTNGKIDQFPYTVGDLRRDNPNTSFPKKISQETMAAYGMFPVVYEEMPVYDPTTQRVEDATVPKLIEGRWVLTRTVVSLTEDELEERYVAASQGVRSMRNQLLQQSDWTQVADAPVDAAAWAIYRQALRDITNHPSFPYLTEADWPVRP